MMATVMMMMVIWLFMLTQHPVEILPGSNSLHFFDKQKQIN
jgi:hypothetical protein